jgi:stearoyl-CoA desaturase (delta-9 desaturase)
MHTMSQSQFEDQSEAPTTQDLTAPKLTTSKSSVAPDFSADALAAQIEPRRLSRPEETQPPKFLWPYLIGLTSVHLLGLLAFIPWLFTWSGLMLAILGHFVFGMLGVTIGYHRLLTHRGFSCPKWLEHSLVTLGMCNLQDSPARWVAIHRLHHRRSDQQADPHSPLVNFFWGHVGWVFWRHKEFDRTLNYARYVPDVLRDPYYLRLERRGGWLIIFLTHSIAIVTVGAVVGYFVGGTGEAVRYGASWAVWAVAVRTVFVLHGTWSVNSLGHLFGYRNYETRDRSTNNWLVAFIAHGEGWHNNHHADPQSAAHGHRWWEFDLSWWVIRAFEAVGLASEVVRPGKLSLAKAS